MAEGSPGAYTPIENSRQTREEPDISLDRIRELSGNNGLVSYVFHETLAVMNEVDTEIINDPQLNVPLQQRIEARLREREQRARERQSVESLRADEERVMADMREPRQPSVRPEDLHEAELELTEGHEEPESPAEVDQQTMAAQGATPLPQGLYQRLVQPVNQQVGRLRIGERSIAAVQKGKEMTINLGRRVGLVEVPQVELSKIGFVVDQLAEMVKQHKEVAVALDAEDSLDLFEELVPTTVMRLGGPNVQNVSVNDGVDRLPAPVVQLEDGQPYVFAEIEADISNPELRYKSPERGSIRVAGLLYEQKGKVKVRSRIRGINVVDVNMPGTNIIPPPEFPEPNIFEGRDFDLQTVLLNELNQRQEFADCQLEGVQMKMEPGKITLILKRQSKERTKSELTSEPPSPVRRIGEEEEVRPHEILLQKDYTVTEQLAEAVLQNGEVTVTLHNNTANDLVKEIVPGVILRPGGDIEKADIEESSHVDIKEREMYVNVSASTSYKTGDEPRSGKVNLSGIFYPDDDQDGRVRVRPIEGDHDIVWVDMPGSQAVSDRLNLEDYLHFDRFDLRQELMKILQGNASFRNRRIAIDDLFLTFEDDSIHLGIRGHRIPQQFKLIPKEPTPTPEPLQSAEQRQSTGTQTDPRDELDESLLQRFPNENDRNDIRRFRRIMRLQGSTIAVERAEYERMLAENQADIDRLRSRFQGEEGLFLLPSSRPELRPVQPVRVPYQPVERADQRTAQRVEPTSMHEFTPLRGHGVGMVEQLVAAAENHGDFVVTMESDDVRTLLTEILPKAVAEKARGYVHRATVVDNLRIELDRGSALVSGILNTETDTKKGPQPGNIGVNVEFYAEGGEIKARKFGDNKMVDLDIPGSLVTKGLIKVADIAANRYLQNENLDLQQELVKLLNQQKEFKNFPINKLSIELQEGALRITVRGQKKTTS